MNDKVSTLIIALLGGAVGVLGVGAVTGAQADPAASSQQPVVIHIDAPAATAGGDVSENVVKLSDVEGLCALGAKAPAGRSSGSRSGSSVNSSGNSANTNTNAIALSNQIGLEQQTIVVQQSDNAAAAVAEQGQAQGQAQQQSQGEQPQEPPQEPEPAQEPASETTTTTTTTTTLPPAEG